MTAIECYNQEIKELFNQFQDGEISGNMFHVQRLASLTKAKEMFEQQIIDSWNNGYREFYDGSSTPEEYLITTFKSNKQSYQDKMRNKITKAKNTIR